MHNINDSSSSTVDMSYFNKIAKAALYCDGHFTEVARHKVKGIYITSVPGVSLNCHGVVPLLTYILSNHGLLPAILPVAC